MGLFEPRNRAGKASSFSIVAIALVLGFVAGAETVNAADWRDTFAVSTGWRMAGPDSLTAVV